MITKEVLEKIKPGAKVRVYEKNTPFEGVIIARKHGNEAGGTFTVRKIILGVGVEKVFPINSPVISKVEIISSPKKIHRAKLYFIRKMPAHKIRQRIKVSL